MNKDEADYIRCKRFNLLARIAGYLFFLIGGLVGTDLLRSTFKESNPDYIDGIVSAIFPWTLAILGLLTTRAKPYYTNNVQELLKAENHNSKWSH